MDEVKITKINKIWEKLKTLKDNGKLPRAEEMVLEKEK